MIPFQGKVKLELMDSNKNIIQKIEGHNMPTKALEYFYKQGGLTNPDAFGTAAIRDNALFYLLGGIMCLDAAITEDNNIVRIPAGVGMVANGARGVLNSGDPTELGSWNESESGWAQDGSFKMVYDWTTSQGNGNIASVCLSSYYGGYEGIGNRTSKARKAGNTQIGEYNSVTTKGMSGQYIGTLNNIAYTVTQVHSVTEWELNAYAMPVEEIDVRDTPSARLLSQTTIAIPELLQNLIPFRQYGSGTADIANAQYIQARFQKNNIVYLFIAANSYYNRYCCMGEGKGTRVAIFNLQTKEFVNVLDVGSIFPEGSGIAYWGVGISDKWAIANNTAVEISNLANVIDITPNIDAGASVGLYAVDSDRFYAENRCVDMILEERNPISSNGIIATYGGGRNSIMQSAGSAIYRDPRYIATIFNLATPVVKTADKTMKVTYILRFPN